MFLMTGNCMSDEAARTNGPGPKKRRWVRWLIEALVVVALLAAVNWYRARDMASGPAPEIQGRLLDGAPVAWSQYRGQPLLIHFWATWCPICRTEESSIDSIADDKAVLTVAMQSGSEAEVAAYMQERQASFPVLVDDDGLLAQRYGVTGVPASFIVDGKGNIRFVEVGYTTELGLRARLWWAGFLAD